MKVVDTGLLSKWEEEVVEVEQLPKRIRRMNWELESLLCRHRLERSIGSTKPRDDHERT